MFLPIPLSQERPQVMLRNIRWLQFPLKSLSFCLTALWEMFTLPFLKQLFYSSGMQTAGAEKTIVSQGTKGQMLPPPLSCMWNPQLFIFIGKLTSRAVPEGREAGEAALLTPEGKTLEWDPNHEAMAMWRSLTLCEMLMFIEACGKIPGE